MTALALKNPNLKLRAEIIKTSWVTNVRWASWSWNWWYYNWWDSFVWNIPQQWDSWTWLALTWTWLENVVIFHLKETFNSKNSYVSAKLLKSVFYNTATSDIIKVQIIVNPTSVWWTAVGSLVYTDVDTNNSVIEYKELWWVVVGWKVIYTDYMVWWGSWANASSWNSDLNAEALWLKGRPWDYFAITYERVSGTWAYNMLWSLNWTEEF